MKRIDKKTGIRVLFLVLFLGLQCSQIFGQNVIQLHRKDGKQKDYIVKSGRRAKINTCYMQTINGKIKEIKDSSIIIGRDATEVPIKDIRYFYCQKINVWNFIGAACFSFLVVNGAYFSILGTIVLGASFGLMLGVVSIPIPCISTIYFLSHKKEFNTQLKYDLSIVKPK